MGYNNDDTWRMSDGEFSDNRRTLSELKDLLKKHIKSIDIRKDISKDTDNLILEEYEITNIRFSIKRKK
jgi:hypothetical protein